METGDAERHPPFVVYTQHTELTWTLRLGQTFEVITPAVSGNSLPRTNNHYGRPPWLLNPTAAQIRPAAPTTSRHRPENTHRPVTRRLRQPGARGDVKRGGGNARKLRGETREPARPRLVLGSR